MRGQGSGNGDQGDSRFSLLPALADSTLFEITTIALPVDPYSMALAQSVALDLEEPTLGTVLASAAIVFCF